LRIVSWNIKRGGKGREGAIVTALKAHEPDLVVLSEYFSDSSSGLSERLLAEGYRWTHSAEETDAPPRVLIASRFEVQAVAPSAPELELRNRWAEVVLPARDLRVAGVYVPVTGSRPGRKRRMWEAVRHAASMRNDEPFLIVGDWNTGDFPADKSRPGRPFKFTDEYRRMVEAGFVEAWRHHHPEEREYSWYRHNGSGFRIDHAFVSPPLLPRVVGCRYSHEERLAGASDHSLLILDIADA
jgi:exodeoxyribonuclease III